MATVRENLIAARALIDTPEKWIKGAGQKGGCFCALGALEFSANGSASLSDMYGVLLDALPSGCSLVSAFNDHPDTTHPMILEVFDRAIAAQETPNA